MPTLRQWLVLGLYVLPVLAYGPYRKSSTFGPKSRDRWLDGFDIHSDYEEVVPPGKLVEYDLVVSQELIAPDGYITKGMVVNKQYPGPTIEANWGDTLRITVHNNLTNDNGTSIHWHGIRQFETNWLDGVPGVTQCPIKPGASQVYEFRAMQYGTSWYHSHFSLQYSNGLYGPIVINGPSSLNYDVDLGPWILSDWYHADAFSLYHIEILTTRAPIPVSSILNGKGVFDCNPGNDTRCTGKNERYEVVFERGTTFRIALLNTGSIITYTFWIAGHNLTVIATDFVPIEPYTTEVLNIGIGQRYEIIIEANADFEHGSNFWIHAHYCNGGALLNSTIGIVRYDKYNTSDPYMPPVNELHYDYGCQVPAPKNLVPVVKRQVGNRVNGLDPEDYLKIGLEAWPNASDANSRIHKWALQAIPMYLDWKEPSLKKLTLESNPQFPPETVPIYLDFDTGEWVYFVITNNYTLNTTYPPRTDPQSVHPIHLHGHDFVILAQGEGPFTEAVVPQLDNPARRDVVDCPLGGYVWIAFQINNPGVWLMHCHMAWHVSDGLALQYIEQPGKIKGLAEKAGVLHGLADQCNEWADWYTHVNEPAGALQDDSGV